MTNTQDTPPTMSLHEALYTTRAMRRMKADPVPYNVQARMIDAAIRAPNGGNEQGWRFVLVDDRDLIVKLAPAYRRHVASLWTDFYVERLRLADSDPEHPDSRATLAMRRSVDALAERFEEVPLVLFAFSPKPDLTGTSTIPAVWSAMLAARAEGVGSSFVNLLTREPELVFDLLDVPTEEEWHLKAVVAFGYPTGRWGIAQRAPAQEVVARNRWDGPLGIEIDAPQWGSR